MYAVARYDERCSQFFSATRISWISLRWASVACNSRVLRVSETAAWITFKTYGSSRMAALGYGAYGMVRESVLISLDSSVPSSKIMAKQKRSPGRFYASAIMKMVSALLIIKFDLQLAQSEDRRWFSWRSFIYPRAKTRVILRPRAKRLIWTGGKLDENSVK